MTQVRSRIEAIRAYVPNVNVENETLEMSFDLPAKSLFQRTGLRARRRSAATEYPTTIGLTVAQDVLAHARASAEDLDLIISAGSSRDQSIPPDAMIYANLLGIEAVECIHVEAVCQSFIVALELADLYVRSGRKRNILIVTSELPSRVTDPSDLGTSILFGDGAAAALIGTAEDGSGIEATHVLTHAVGDNIRVAELRAGGLRYHPRSPDTTQEDYFFRVNGAAELRLAEKYLPAILAELMAKAGCSLDEIDWIIPHQVLPKMIHTLIRRLRIDGPRVFINECYGNQAAASIPVALGELVEAGLVKRGSRVLLIGGAAGFTVGGAVVRY
jgi:3-oxoacyl-[acyl-carrier-protein] synthase III